MSIKHLLMLFLGLLMSCNEAPTKNGTKKANEVFSLYADLEGNLVSLEDFKGKKIVLNYWATWCTPCLKEMPSMVRAQELLQIENFVFLFATTDDIEKIIEFKQRNSYPFQFLQFKTSLDKLNIYALPATFLYDSKGNLVKRIDGATVWDSEEMLNQLREIR